MNHGRAYNTPTAAAGQNSYFKSPPSSSYHPKKQSGGGGCQYDDDDEISVEELVFENPTSLNLPHLLVPWTDSKLASHFTVYVWLPSGISKSDLDAKVDKGGLGMSLGLTWPKEMQDASNLTHGLYRPGETKFINTELELKKHRTLSSDSPNDNLIRSKMHICFNKKVEEKFVDHLIHNDDIPRTFPGYKLDPNGNYTDPGRSVLAFSTTVSPVARFPVTIAKFELMVEKENYEMPYSKKSPADTEYNYFYDDSPTPSSPASSNGSSKKKRKTPEAGAASAAATPPASASTHANQGGKSVKWFLGGKSNVVEQGGDDVQGSF